jgi:hypothetical protein
MRSFTWEFLKHLKLQYLHLGTLKFTTPMESNLMYIPLSKLSVQTAGNNLVLAEELRHRFMDETVQCRVLRGFECNSIWAVVLERDKNNGIG